MKTILVKCTFVIPIEIDENTNYEFDIEENHCPGSGIVGMNLDEHMEKCDRDSVCWACALGGECEIITN